jgi:hypothetical protein
MSSTKDNEVIPFFDRRNLVINCENTMNIIIGCSVLYTLYVEQTFMSTMCDIITSYAFVDLFFCKSELITHHTYILSIFLFKVICQVDSYHDTQIVLALGRTELSTVFYAIKLWMDQYKQSITTKTSPTFDVVYTLNDIIFVVLFMKLRVYDYYYNIIANYGFHLDMWEHYIGTNYFYAFLLYYGIYGVYYLNLYWGALIVKKAFKPLLRYITFNEEQVIQYIYFLNIPVAMSMYRTRVNIDIFGIYILSMCSFVYHNNKVQQNTSVIDITHNNNTTPYLLDVMAIQLRSFGFMLFTFTSSTNEDYSLIICTSLIIHIWSVINIFFYLNYSIHKKQPILTDDKNDVFSLMESVVALPSVINTGILLYYVDSYRLRCELVMVTIWLYINIRINPFYKYSRIAFHIGLIAQTYVLCKIHHYMNYY